MLGVKSYTPDYIEACRARVERDLAAYRSLPSSTPAFEASYFSNMGAGAGRNVHAPASHR